MSHPIHFNQELKSALGAIYDLMHESDVTDIMLNPNGQLWVKRYQKSAYFNQMIQVQQAQMIIRLMYSYAQVDIKKQSFIEAKMPILGARFSGLCPPLVEQESFTIRLAKSFEHNLSAYVLQNIMTQEQFEIIESAIFNFKNILIIGGTGTGKTTLLNTILRHIIEYDANQRLVILQDTPEIQLNSAHAILLNTDGRTDMDQLLSLSLRLYPKRIILGEIRSKEAYQLLKAWNTGHPGGLATLHANNYSDAIDRLMQLISESNGAISRDFIAKSLDVMIILEDQNGLLRIKDVVKAR
jgi:type IV secretion system protein TrbB